MYISLLAKLFLRQRSTLISLLLLLMLGCLAIGIGKQFLQEQRNKIKAVEEIQEQHIQKQVTFHPDDLGLALYYLKFAYIKPINPLSGIAIGQNDVNNSIQNPTILALEGQKYDTELVNPSKQQAGNLDLSFVIVFLFPLIIIAQTFNLWYEELERGTWKIVKIQGISTFRFLMAKLGLRILLVFTALALLFIVAKIALDIPLNRDFLCLILMSYLYLTFWFAVGGCVVSFGKSSGTNAITLLAVWLVLVVVAPVTINNYVTHRYPIGESMSLSVRQRDQYHKKWDTDKRMTINKFDSVYPQYSHYPIQDSGFSWRWYYAMQHMGDLESAKERSELNDKLHKRNRLSTMIADYIPSLKVQMVLSQLGRSDLTSYLDFLEGTTVFHERKRLHFYPYIFDKAATTDIDWSSHKPEYHVDRELSPVASMFVGITVLSLLLGGVAIYRLRFF